MHDRELSNDAAVGAALSITSRRDGTVCFVELCGELDLRSRQLLAAEVGALMKAGAVAGVELDASHVRFIDSAGLTSLIALRATAEALGLDVRVAAVSRPVERLLELTGLTDQLLPADTLAGATTS